MLSDILKLQNNKKKRDDNVERTNGIKLTGDSLTDIKLMLPLLDGRSKERLADMIYRYFISKIYSQGQME